MTDSPRQLGRRTPKRAPQLRFADFWTGVVPDHPAAADHFAQVADWGLYGNDTYGDCGPVSVANQRKLISRYLAGAEQSPTQDDVFALYRASGNPAFDPNDPGGPGDGGVDMQTMCEALVKVGIGAVKALGFASVDPKNLAEVDAAIAIFGSVLFGVNLEVAQQAQTNAGLWDYQQSSEWGGHAVLSGRYASAPPAAGAPQGIQMPDRTGVITWAELVDTTDAFLGKQLEEAWVVIWPEHLGSRAFLEGVNLSALAADYQALTGHPFPAPVTPTPTPPGPSPAPGGDPDQALAVAAHQWLTHHHIADNAHFATAVRAWLAAKGL